MATEEGDPATSMPRMAMWTVEPTFLTERVRASMPIMRMVSSGSRWNAPPLPSCLAICAAVGALSSLKENCLIETAFTLKT